MAAVVDYDLGNQLRKGVIVLAEGTRMAGSWYLHGPADGTDCAEDVGCDWDVHGMVSPKSYTSSFDIRLETKCQSVDSSILRP